MKNWKKAIALVASAAALVSVAACGSSNAGGSSDSGKKTVGFVAVGPEGGFRTANEKDIQKAFEDAGFDLTYSPTQNNDQQKQIQAFNKFVNDEVDAIILSSTEDSGWDDSLKKAAEAEIPVFTVDRNVDVKDAEAKKAIVAHIGPSNVWCGEQAAEFVNKNFPDGANGFILDGFPRNTAQAVTLDSELSAMGREIDCALLVDVAPEVIIDRLSSRRTCRACGYTGTAADATCPKCGGEMYQRDDDKPETIKNRLDVYEKSTSPLVDYYRGQGLLKSVNGDQARETVYGDVKEALGL